MVNGLPTIIDSYMYYIASYMYSLVPRLLFLEFLYKIRKKAAWGRGYITCNLIFFVVLEQLKEHPAALEFTDPVEKERAPDYYDLIAEPMCLSLMTTKVREGAYKTVKMVSRN